MQYALLAQRRMDVPISENLNPIFNLWLTTTPFRWKALPWRRVSWHLQTTNANHINGHSSYQTPRQRVRENDTATLWCAACLLVADGDFGIYRGAAETELIACDGDIWCVSSLARRFVLPGTLRASKPKDKHPDTQPFCCNPRKRTLSSPSSS